MQTEITNELLARVYGAYYGCETTFVDDEGNICKVDAEVIAQVLRYGVQPRDDHGFAGDKLQLTPLSSITDEDCMEVAKMVMHPNVSYPANHYRIKKLEPYNTTEIEIDNDWYNEKVNIGAKHGMVWQPDRKNARIGAEVYDFLRSRGYDTGFAHIPSLIAAGIAINKETLKP